MSLNRVLGVRKIADEAEADVDAGVSYTAIRDDHGQTKGGRPLKSKSRINMLVKVAPSARDGDTFRPLPAVANNQVFQSLRHCNATGYAYSPPVDKLLYKVDIRAATTVLGSVQHPLRTPVKVWLRRSDAWGSRATSGTLGRFPS